MQLLRALHVERVDLLVITHPDADHVVGLDAVLRRFEVTRLWRYPSGSLVRDFLATNLGTIADPRFAPLRDAHQAIDNAVRRGDLEVNDGGCGTPVWAGSRNSYEVTCIAPTSFDRLRMQQQFQQVLRLESGRDPELSSRLLEFLLGNRSWSDHPNAVSLAVVIRCGDLGVLLAGDVENGTDHRASGWKGILDRLSGRGGEPSKLDLLTDLELVKIAHHGSKGAFHNAAWNLHSQNRSISTAVIMPFTRMGSPLPDAETLGHLPRHASRLLLTSSAGSSAQRANEAGWRAFDAARVGGSAPAVAVRLDESGAQELWVSGTATALKSG